MQRVTDAARADGAQEAAHNRAAHAAMTAELAAARQRVEDKRAAELVEGWL